MRRNAIGEVRIATVGERATVACPKHSIASKCVYFLFIVAFYQKLKELKMFAEQSRRRVY